VADPEDLHLQRLMPADALRIRGRHNAANALAALALATAIGCPLAPMLHGLREYRGEPHRVAFVASIVGVEAFDDSKGTNVGATVARCGLAPTGAGARLVVILGGDGKGQDFAPLAAPVAQHARAVALIGRDAAAIEAALAASGVPMQRHESLEDATAWCFAQARAGDAVLLSPACASLDMFRNYGHRAEVFVAAVQAHAAAQGEFLDERALGGRARLARAAALRARRLCARAPPRRGCRSATGSARHRPSLAVPMASIRPSSGSCSRCCCSAW
jgi:UDP-N-acetylmuramoylalanine--D-glutamate ligase